jgi:hypothetical protein
MIPIINGKHHSTYVLPVGILPGPPERRNSEPERTLKRLFNGRLGAAMAQPEEIKLNWSHGWRHCGNGCF